MAKTTSKAVKLSSIRFIISVPLISPEAYDIIKIAKINADKHTDPTIGLDSVPGKLNRGVLPLSLFGLSLLNYPALGASALHYAGGGKSG